MASEIVKVGEKGQITIPVEIRKTGDLRKGDLVEVVSLEDNSIFITKLDRKRELIMSMKLLGKALEEKGYKTTERIVRLCKEVRKDVYRKRKEQKA